MNFIQLLIISVISNVTANILLKTGVTKAGGIILSKDTFIADFFKVAFNPFIIGGLFLYGFSFILWLRVLSFNDLSRAYPIFVTCVFLLSTIGSVVFLKESVPFLRIIGILVLVFGIFIVART